ncbi:E3 ubiquitin-protein ligase MARCHF2-like [Cataglyphis hispanica]|uniref:E3 ubiquitin-protein ligase MARCHF2-like n=1 Tax=Cataglyphis hispanica TaxID=1086592 RepID=UPI00217F6076|nr:E3 ubiquitin-protein ligase MARCHF2-like [Cataglyphis hispanica]
MGEFGLNDLCERLKEEIPLLKEKMSITALCWRCNEGKNKGKLVSPCKCIKQFIHVDCLEISANTQNILHCLFCHTQYPLDIRRKSLLECYRDNTLLQMFREVCSPLFKLLAFIFYSFFLIGILIYIVTLFDYILIKDNLVIVIIIMLMILTCFYTFLFFVYTIEPFLSNWFDKIRNIYRKYTQEVKLKTQYSYVGII